MSELNSRERVKLALNHQEPDRVPLGLGGSAHKLAAITDEKLRDHFDIKEKRKKVLTGLKATYYSQKLVDALGIDLRYVHIKWPDSFSSLPDSDCSIVNEWGLKVRYRDNFIEITNHPLAELSEEKIENYPWPDPYDIGRIDNLEEEAKYLYDNTDYALAAYRPVPAGIYELAALLCGTEKLLITMVQDPDLISLLFNKIMEVQLGLYEMQLKAVGKYVEIVEIIDDLGTQEGLLFSPDIYRNLLKPCHSQLVKSIKEIAPDVNIMLHSCGAVSQFIDDFIDIGVDILNPVQPRANGMNTEDLNRSFGESICFLGGVDVQQSLRGTQEDVISETEKRIKDLAPGGGYIFAPSHNLGGDVPVENIMTMYKTARKKGSYPIT